MLQRPTPEDLRRAAAQWRFSLDSTELEQYGILSEYMMQIVDGLEADLVPSGGPLARHAGTRLGPGEDPLNAIVRRVSVRADSPSGSLLAGKRIAVKDNISVAGVPLSAASNALGDYVPSMDATVVKRVLDNGGEIVALTNMDLLSCSAGGESSLYGPIRNPVDGSRAAGGSSSGSAAALFYDWVDIALGCDQGGSIRLPSSWCGVLGLKPTHGLVPYTGILGLDQTLDFCGPMSRTTHEAAALLQAIAGLDPGDPRQRTVVTADYVKAVAQAPDDLAGLRVGLVVEGLSSDVGITGGMAAATERFVRKLRDLGAQVTEVSIPEHLQGGAVAFDAYAESLNALLRSGGNTYESGGLMFPALSTAIGESLADSGARLSPQVKVLLMVGAHLTERYHGALYAAGQNRKPSLRKAYDDAFTEYDVLLTPTAPWTAHEILPDAPISEHVQRGWDNLSNTSIFDLTGHPALSIPAEQDEGLPAGMQVVGAHFKEASLLSLARTVERRYGWFPTASSH